MLKSVCCLAASSLMLERWDRWLNLRLFNFQSRLRIHETQFIRKLYHFDVRKQRKNWAALFAMMTVLIFYRIFKMFHLKQVLSQCHTLKLLYFCRSHVSKEGVIWKKDVRNSRWISLRNYWPSLCVTWC